MRHNVLTGEVGEVEEGITGLGFAMLGDPRNHY